MLSLVNIFYRTCNQSKGELIFEIKKESNSFGPPNVNFVVVLLLPSSDNQKLLLKLDEGLNNFKIIILGAYNETDIVNSIMNKRIMGYVLKRSTATDLFQAVEKVLAGNIYISPLGPVTK